MFAIEALQKEFRSKTHQLHRELDSLDTLTGLLIKPFDPQRYADALTALQHPHAYLEQIIADTLKNREIAYQYEPRSPYLAQDLSYIGKADTEADSFHPLPQPDVAQLFGLLYLLEGSKLGGAFLLKRLTAAGAPVGALNFFSASVNEQSDWQGFWQACQTHLQSEEMLERSVNAAATAFSFYIACVRTHTLQPELLLPVSGSNQGLDVAI